MWVSNAIFFDFRHSSEPCVGTQTTRVTRQKQKDGQKIAEVNAAQRSCVKCRAAGRHTQALGHKGCNCPYELVYVSD
jgi:hypothetical protein